MSNQHNRWLSWKVRHGLAHRGRASAGSLKPKGVIAKVLYVLYFRWQAIPTPYTMKEGGGKLFHQNVGGSVGSTGETKT